MHISYRFTIYALLFLLVAPTTIAQTTIPTDTKQSCATGQYLTITDDGGLGCFTPTTPPAPEPKQCGDNQAINRIANGVPQCTSLPKVSPTDVPTTCKDGDTLRKVIDNITCTEPETETQTKCGSGEFAVGFNPDGTPICDELPEDTISIAKSETKVTAQAVIPPPAKKTILTNAVILPAEKTILPNPVILPPAKKTIIPNPITLPIPPSAEIVSPSNLPDLTIEKPWCHTSLSHLTPETTKTCTDSFVPLGINTTDNFGASISFLPRGWLNEAMLAVGLPGDGHQTINQFHRFPGKVVTCEKKKGVWTCPFKVGAVQLNLKDGDQFGSAVSWLDADTLAIGAMDRGDGGTDRGAVYICEKKSAGWDCDVKIGNNQGVTLRNNSRFGRSIVWLDAKTLAIGAAGERSVYICTRTNTTTRTWSCPTASKLQSVGADSISFIEWDTCSDGNLFLGLCKKGENIEKRIAVGDWAKNSNRGAVYVCSNAGGSWSCPNIPNIAHGSKVSLRAVDHFGAAVSWLNSTTLAVGAPYDDTGGTRSNSNRGAVYICTRTSATTDDWSCPNTSKIAHDGSKVSLGNSGAFGISVAWLNTKTLLVGADRRPTASFIGVVYACTRSTSSSNDWTCSIEKFSEGFGEKYDTGDCYICKVPNPVGELSRTITDKNSSIGRGNRNCEAGRHWLNWEGSGSNITGPQDNLSDVEQIREYKRGSADAVASCPSGWRMHEFWTETQSIRGYDKATYFPPANASCNTGGHKFSNTKREVCLWLNSWRNCRYTIGGGCQGAFTSVTGTLACSDVVAVGCVPSQ